MQIGVLSIFQNYRDEQNDGDVMRGELAIARHGRSQATDAVRHVIETLRSGGAPEAASVDHVGRLALDRLEERARPSQRAVINLTGTVLHTNLGRALLAEEAIEAVVAAMRAPTNLEYGIEAGQRGERDAHAPAAGEFRTGTQLIGCGEAEARKNSRRTRRCGVRVDIDKPGLDVGDAMRVLRSFGFLQQRGALDVGLEHDLDQAFRAIGCFLRQAAHAPARRNRNRSGFQRQIAANGMK